jgi:hypothetical protein
VVYATFDVGVIGEVVFVHGIDHLVGGQGSGGVVQVDGIPSEYLEVSSDIFYVHVLTSRLR